MIDTGYLRKVTPYGARDSSNNFNCQGKVIYGNNVNGSNLDIPNLGWIRARYIKMDGSNSMTGKLQMGNNQITGLSDPNGNDHAVNKDNSLIGYLKKDGSVTLTGDLNMNNKRIITIAYPVDKLDAMNKFHLGRELTNFINKNGQTAMSANFNINNKQIVNLGDNITNPGDVVNKNTLIQDFILIPHM